MIPEILEFADPEGAAAPIGVVALEPLVVPLEGPPGEEMKHAVESQRFDDAHAARLEFGEFRIPFEKERALARGVVGAARQEEPEVLDRRADHHVVEVEEEEAFAGPGQDIAAVEVAVDSPCAERRYVASGEGDGFAAEFREFKPEFGMDEGFHDGEVGQRELRSEREPRLGAPFCADDVQPAGEGAEAKPVVVGFGVEASAAPFWKEREGEIEAFVLVQGNRGQAVAFEAGQRRHDGEFGFRAVGEEAMLLEDGFLRPAARPIEFHDIFLLVLAAEAVDSVHVARVGPEAAFRSDAEGRFDRLEDDFRREGVEGAGVVHESASRWASSSQRNVLASISGTTSP